MKNLVKQIVLNKAEDQKLIDVNSLNPGVYMLYIKNRDKVVETGKLIISY
jgi:hypothetical protein